MSPRLMLLCALSALLLFTVSSWASISIVADLDSNATNGPDTVAVDVGDTVLVRVWITDGLDSLVSIGITLGDTAGALTWIEEEADSFYTTPTGWVNIPGHLDTSGRVLIQAADFGHSMPLIPPSQVAELKFVAVSAESCAVLSWDSENSGWQDWGFVEGTFSSFGGAVVCGSSEEDGGGGDSGEQAVPGSEDQEEPGLADSTNLAPHYFDARGNPVDYDSQFASADMVPGEVLVWFKAGTVAPPQGREADIVDVEDMDLASDVADACETVSAMAFRRVFPRFGEGDLRTLPDGDGVRREKIDLRNVYRLSIPTNASVKEAIEVLRRDESVVWAEPNYLLKPAAVPDDPRLDDQWPNSPDGGGDYIGVEEAWDSTTGREGLRLGFVDTGVDWSHGDLGGGIGSNYHVKGGYDFFDSDWDPTDETSNSHGTKIAGIAAALTDNGLGIAGLVGGWADSMGASVYAFKTSDSTGLAPVSNVADAIQTAASPSYYGCQVIACGLAMGSASVTLEIACANAHLDRAVLVCPRGNEGTSAPQYPAGYPWPVSVGGSDVDGNRWDSTSYGLGMDLVAPADDILSTIRSSGYDKDDGTSLAVGYAAGCAAMMLSHNEDLLYYGHPEDVKAGLRVGCIDKGEEGYDSLFGAGRLDADSVLKATSYPHDMIGADVWIPDTSMAGVELTHDGTGVYFFVDGPDGNLNGAYWAKRYCLRYTLDDLPQPIPEGTEPYSFTGTSDVPRTGWSGANPNIQMRFREVVDWSESEVVQDTYFYEVWEYQLFPPQIGSYLGWFPYDPRTTYTMYTYRFWAIPSCVGVTSSRPESQGDAGSIEARPNPGRGQVIIRFNMRSSDRTRLAVYDIQGRFVADLGCGRGDFQDHEIVWDGRNRRGDLVSSGTYVLRLSTEGARGSERVMTRKVNLVR